MFSATIPLHGNLDPIRPCGFDVCRKHKRSHTLCKHQTPEVLEMKRFRLVVRLCRDLHSKGMIYTVKYYLTGENPGAEILAEREDRL
jgi:hypothetical protein